MEVEYDGTPLSQQVNYQKMKSDWHVFNNQDKYEFKRPDKFCSKIVKYAKSIKIVEQIEKLQDEMKNL